MWIGLNLQFGKREKRPEAFEISVRDGYRLFSWKEKASNDEA